MDFVLRCAMALILISITACSVNNSPTSADNSDDDEWSIPVIEVFEGGPGKDGIPALTTPAMTDAKDAFYLNGGDLVIGYKQGDDVRAYPHKILDWHEIINDEVDNHPVAVIYCPLAGTGTGWNRTIDGQVTTFRVSGLLYNTNVMPYDSLTNSHWSQMRLDCVNGELRNERAETVHTVETSWKTWNEMFPQTKVVSKQTGFSRDYDKYPYGSYKTEHETFLFPYGPKDSRLPNKERVLGILIDGKAKVYRFRSFDDEISVHEDRFKATDLVIAGSKKHNFMVAFERTLKDGTLLTFSAASFEGGVSAVILRDGEGNEWNIFGEAVAGPRSGQKLTPVTSFMGYWFAWAAFYPHPKIFD